MTAMTADELCERKCQPCEGGVEPYSREEAETQTERLDGWVLSPDAKRIRKSWTMQDFAAGMKFLNDVAAIAEDEGHHPDLYLQGYRDVTVELTTHAIDGLSENDFIIAARLENLEPQLKNVSQ